MAVPSGGLAGLCWAWETVPGWRERDLLSGSMGIADLPETHPLLPVVGGGQLNFKGSAWSSFLFSVSYLPNPRADAFFLHHIG